MVGGLTLGVFHDMGIQGWWAPAATLVFAFAAVWLLASVLTLLRNLLSRL
jgi:hypothetical protein